MKIHMFLILFLGVCSVTFSQGVSSKAVRIDDVPEEETRLNNNFRQADQKLGDYVDKLRSSHSLNSLACGKRRGAPSWSKEQLEAEIVNMRKLIRVLNDSQLKSLANAKNTARKSVLNYYGKSWDSSMDAYRRYRECIANAENNIRLFQQKIAQQDNEKAEEQKREQAIQEIKRSNASSLKALENDIIKVKAQNGQINNQLNTYASNLKPIDDFLSETVNMKSARITTKDKLQGVVAKNGKVLIPFKEWEILEFKSGIAKVRKKLTSYKPEYDSRGVWYGGINAFIFEEGFVESTGKFISSNITYQIYEPMIEPDIYMISEGADAELVAARRKEKRRKEQLEREKFKITLKRWALQKIKQYQ